jgi:peptide/nickel transport system substrate-binding protein
MKTLFATAASMIALYVLFLLISFAGQPDDAEGERSTLILVPPYVAPPPEEPQYGGTLDIGNLAITLSALSWDPADWNWKQNMDMGMYFEQLFAADLDKSIRKGGPYPFTMQAYLPADSIRGEIVETWEWEDPLTVVMHLRHGIMFPDKPGVMTRRELTADDVVFSFERQANSPKLIPTYFDHIDSVVARDDHTVVFNFNEFNAEWDYRFGFGYYSGILPRELGDVDVKDWRNHVGSGPFQIEKFIDGSSQTYAKTPDYWDRELLNGERYEIPFIDKFVFRTIKDKGTWLTALRTGQLDILEAIDWISVDHLRHTTPELKWSRWMSTNGIYFALRCDQEPFDDVRVRRALNLAINQVEIAELFFGGNAQVMAFPQKPTFGAYYTPLEEMPASVQELFTYNPEKAKQLLAEAGYPDGFTFLTQVNSADPSMLELVPLLIDYLAKVGVTLEIQTMEYAAHLSAMTTRTHGPGYLAGTGHVNPTTTLRKNFLTGQTWNMSAFSDPEIDARILEMLRTRDEETRQQMARDLTADMLDLAPAIWLPVAYVYSAWWPWVKNYNGELRAGAQRAGPIYARIWIDQEMKKEMGFE